MRKIFFVLMVVFCYNTALMAVPYGLLINGTIKLEATALPDNDNQDRQQFLVSGVELKEGDIVQLYDIGSDVSWTCAIDPYGEYEKFTKNTYHYVCNVTGSYDFYIRLKYNDDLLYIGPGQNCTTSVPSECEDVMLQAFYFDSYRDGAPGDVVISGTTKLGNTKWSTLLNQSGEIGTYFDLVWLPPSGKSEGGTGYHQTQYSNQNSAWGTQAELVEFINRMHAVGTKVVADIVINHAGTKSSWCDFYTQYFGEYGTFTPDASWIAQSDELNNASEAGDCKGSATGPEDGGYNGQNNYGAARDWAHAKPEVQNMMKAYLKWMKNVIGFDGWRYDYAQGFKGKYIDMYNSAAENYFSVVEFWNNDVIGYLGETNWNTLAFDFGTKYSAIQGIADGNYQKCMGSGLLGAGKSKYAVTFVDNHDTYFGCVGRDNQDEIGGCQKSMEDYNKDRVLGANAFILSMPGVPCVFYPHWVKYKDAIGKMVLARKAAGVHSESQVSDEAGNGFYKSTIIGKHGSIRLLLGPNSGFNTTPSGYKLAYKGGNFAMYYTTTQSEVPILSITPTTIYKTETLTVEMSATALSGTPTIYYTLDGTDPTTSATKKTYTSAFTINGTVTVKAYATLNGANSQVQEATYTYQTPQTTPLVLKFYPPKEWGKVYLYAWDTNGASINGRWPGVELTEKDNDGWFFYVFDAKYREVNVILHNEGYEQSNDIFLDQNACYEWKDGAEVLSDKCSEEIGDCTITTTVNNSKYGLTCGDTIVPWGTYITISAKANYGYHFSQWDDGIKENPRTVLVTGSKTYIAYFNRNTYHINKHSGEYGQIYGYDSALYLDEVTLSAEPHYGYHFTQWSDGVTDNPRTFILTQDTTFTAEFAPNQYNISTSVDDTICGVTFGDTTATYLDYIEITAKANYGYHFENWNDGNADNPRRVQVRRDETYTAYFEKDTYSVTTNYNSEQGYIDGVSSAKYLDMVTLTAMPKLGYEFVRWSDGNTSNPRIFTLTQDTAFTAEFAQTFSGQCGDNLYWDYDKTNHTISITESGDMYDYTAETQPWLLFKEDIKEVTVANTATSIGTSAFEGCIRLGKISLGTGLKNIAANAFAGCTRLYDIYLYATYPPFAEESSFANYNVYVYIPCEYQRDYILDVVWGKFRFIECLGAESEDMGGDDVVVTPGSTDVTITWPTEDNADNYTIVIKKDGEVFCTLTFNAEGQLLNIAFAPGRDGNHPAQYAEAVANGKGYRFTVTGLTEATQYAYNIDVRDAANKTINSHSGEFTTNGGTTTDMDNIQSPITTCQKLLRDGQLIILRDGKTYTTMGAEIQ